MSLDRRDLRDPEALGRVYLRKRSWKRPVSIETAAKSKVADYQDGGFISSDPANHHSKTTQRESLQ